jgi:hypothetical protein
MTVYRLTGSPICPTADPPLMEICGKALKKPPRKVSRGGGGRSGDVSGVTCVPHWPGLFSRAFLRGKARSRSCPPNPPFATTGTVPGNEHSALPTGVTQQLLAQRWGWGCRSRRLCGSADHWQAAAIHHDDCEQAGSSRKPWPHKSASQGLSRLFHPLWASAIPLKGGVALRLSRALSVLGT